MNRKQAIAQIKYAGYHGDTARGMRVYIENRISYQVYKARPLKNSPITEISNGISGS